MEKNKYDKISLGLLISSMLVAFIVCCPQMIFFSLISVGLILGIKFKLARWFLYIIFIIIASILIKFIINFHFLVFQDYLNFLWLVLLTSGLLVKFRYCGLKVGNNKVWAGLGILTICVAGFNYFINNSSPNYTSEIEIVGKENHFIVSEDVIRIPLNRFLIIKSSDSGKLCLFKINQFRQSSFIYNSILLKKADVNKFIIEGYHTGEIYYNSSLACELFAGFKIVFLPVNSLVRWPYYSYGYMADKLPVDGKKIIYLPENKIIWSVSHPVQKHDSKN